MHSECVLTTEGHTKLLEELDLLVSVKRREVAERIKAAIEFGDISENSEYDDAKNEQAFIEGRISQINDMLSNFQLIDECTITTEKVCLGCCVVLKDLETGDKDKYRMVGSVEADPENHKISNESPVGSAIIGKASGEVVDVSTPSGTIKYKIVSISK